MAVKEVLRDGKTCYRVQVSRLDSKGRRHQRKRYANNLAEAYCLERDLTKELGELAFGARQLLWSELIQEYYQHISRTKAPTTQDREHSSIEAHINPVFNNKLLGQIKSSDVDDLILGALAEKSKHTQKTLLRYISSVFNFAIDRGYLESNPCRGKSRLIRVEEKLKPTLDADQVRHLLHKAKEMDVFWYPHWAFCCYSGLRNGELFFLRAKHIDLKKNLITVEGSWSSKAGFHTTKNREVRFVPINPRLRELIVELFEKYKPESPEAFVLPRESCWEKGNQARELRLFCKAIGLPPINFHSLRSIYITQLLLNNTPLPITMRLVGHKQLSTVLRYLKLTGKEIISSTDCLDFSWKEEKEVNAA